MLNTNDLLDRVKAVQGIKSEYRLCRVVGVADQTLANWRKGKAPSDEYAAKLAQLAQMDMGLVLASIAAERVKDPTLQAAFSDIARRLQLLDVANLAAFLGGGDQAKTTMNTGT
jgi:transcriptional regulator with XRE-family HTH domain